LADRDGALREPALLRERTPAPNEPDRRSGGGADASDGIPDPFTSAPKSLLDTNGFAKVVRVEEKPRGGHFAALEQPKLWADDVFTFFTGLSK